MSHQTHTISRPLATRRPLWTGVAASLLAVAMTAGGAAGAFAATSGSEVDQAVESPLVYDHLWVHPDNAFAQTFTAGSTGLLTDLEVSISNADHMVTDGVVEIQRVDAEGYPTGMAIASTTFAPNPPNGWLSLSFAAPASVISGTKYAFVATITPSEAAPNEYNSYLLANTSNAYGGGDLFESVDGQPYGSLDSDLLFRTYVAPRSAPDAPADVTAVPGDGLATVSWTAPADHDSAITSYTAMASTGETCIVDTTTCTIDGLENGTAYTFAVYATNAFGDSELSLASASIIPLADVSAPVDVVVADLDATPVASGAPELAKTGADSAGTATLAALLLGGGLAMLLVARRRRLQA